jgi:hypothetical protein
MRSKRMLMGAAVIGCLAAAMTSGAYAQEANTNQQLNARTGHQPAASAQTGGSIRQVQSPNTNAQLNARTSNGMSANGQLERRGSINESRMGASARAGHGYAEQRALRGERGTYARVSEQRFGRGERGLYARAGVEGGYRGGRVANRERAVGTGVGVAAADYGYRGRRLYAYAPGYETGYAVAPRYSYSYAAAPRYSYTPGFDIGVNTGPYYAPAWNTAYAGPYDYAPGVSFGIGIGPVGIGFGPAWGW